MAQCGVGVGTVQEISMDPMSILFGSTCSLDLTLRRRFKSNITGVWQGCKEVERAFTEGGLLTHRL